MGFDNKQLGFNALHHFVQSYADRPTLENNDHHNHSNLVASASVSVQVGIHTNANIDANAIADINANANALKPLPCHLGSIKSILCTTWGKEACLQQTRDGLFTPLHLCCRSIVPDEITRIIATACPAAISMQDEEGDTPLHSAFRYGASDEVIQTLIDLSYNFNFSQDGDDCAFGKLNDHGELALHTAISHEASGRSVKLLLDAHPQGILAYNGRLQSPLHVACETGRYDIIDVILNSHASIDSVESLLEVRDEMGLTPIFILWRQVCAFNNEHCSSNESDSLLESMECITKLLKATEFFELGPNESTNQNDSDFIAYQLLKTSICLGSNVVPGEYVAFLIKYNPRVLSQTDSNGRLLLHTAVAKYQQPSTHNGHNLENDIYQHTLHECCSLETKIYNVSDLLPAYHYDTDNTLFIDLILKANNSAAFIRDNAGKLPLHIAIDAGISWQGMRNLIKMNPLAIQEQDPVTGLLPFMSAAAKKPNESNHLSDNSVDAIFRLLRSSPDTVLPALDKSQNYYLVESPPMKRQKMR